MISRETLQENQQAGERYNGVLMSPCIGRIAPHGNSGEVMVEVNGSGARAARLLSSVSRHELTRPESEGREVLLVFEQDDSNRPIIIGLMEDPLENLLSMEISVETRTNPPLMKEVDTPTSSSGGGEGDGEHGLPHGTSQKPKEAQIDGKRVTIEAEEEIVLKCGSGSITLRKDGKIVIKGTHLLSRSSGPIRVKGARVDIN